MSLSQPLVRFDFGLDLQDGAAAPPRTKRHYLPDEVEDIRRVAYAEGEASAVAKAEEAAAAALQEIAANAREAMSQLAALTQEHRAGTARLALACGRQIAGAALDRFPEAPAAAALAALEREVAAEPRLTVRAAPDLLPRLQAALTQVAQSIGFEGRIEGRAEPGLPPAAFTLDWGDGAARFDPQAAAGAVADALETALAASAPSSSSET